MGKPSRKPRPSMPNWYWLDQDGCWFCHGKKRNNCNQCKWLKKTSAEIKMKRRTQERQKLRKMKEDYES